jgi:transcriptional regulator with XRE-family HTH domain
MGRQRADQLRSYLGRELRIARIGSGLTQQTMARLAGVSQEYVSQVERGVVAPSLDVACRLAAAGAHELSLKLYPTTHVPLRESGQLAIAERITAATDRSWRMRMEVPIGDGRAHDLVIDRSDEVAAIEIERSLSTLEAQARRGLAKRDALAQRDSRPVRFVLAVPDTRAMRDLIREHADFFARVFPVPSRAVWNAVKRGHALGGDGILFVRHGHPIDEASTFGTSGAGPVIGRSGGP